MMKYDFKNVFIKYVILLSVIMMFMYVCIIMIFSWQVNSEIKESSSKQFDSLKASLNDKELINKGTSYFTMNDGKIIHNRTDISNDILNS
ncbi:hypothetical protein RPO40_11190, partial [Mammaliicoccus fleurettii]|nr:hypothetical protein [Mammaliicoccus fleurettii]